MLTTVPVGPRSGGTGHGGILFESQIVFWLWFTVLFANFAEAVAEGRGKAQADALRRTRTETPAKKLADALAAATTEVPGMIAQGRRFVLVEAGDIIPSDGEIVEGVASVDESAITGESAPVIRESGGDRSAVTGGTKLLSDWVKVRITAAQGSTFLDRMIALVEGASRQKTPNEIALNILLIGMTLIFVMATVTIPSFATYAGGSRSRRRAGGAVRLPDPDDDRRFAVGHRHRRHGPAGEVQRARNVRPRRSKRRATSIRLLLDKTGTITLGNRVATELFPCRASSRKELADAAQLSSLSDETPEGRSVVVLAKEKYGIRAREMAPLNAKFIPFTAQTRG